MTALNTAAGSREPLAVIGLSCLFPQSADVEEFWSNIRRGVDAITEIPPTHWNVDAYFDADQKTPDKTYARRGGFLSPVAFDPLEFGIAPSNLEAIDTSQLLGLVGAKRALDDAGYGAGRQFDRSRVGCILGVTGTLEMVIPLGARLGHPKWRQALKDAGVADDVAADVIQRISDSYVPWQENSFPGLLGNVVAGRIANRLDLGGTNCVVDAACASSLSAIHLAALELWSGRSEMVVTGGVDTFNDIFMYMCFSKTPALSPTGDARPFSESSDGTILGEGVGMLVLKRLSDAERDGDKVYALIRGIGTSSDGAGNAVYAPKKEGQVRCLQDAYHVAGVSPQTVELIEAHGTGTKVGDATELAGLSEVFEGAGAPSRWCAVGSIKSQIGHTKAAAGAAGVLKAILSLQHRVLPPTIKLDRPLAGLLEESSPLYANTQARPWLARKDHPRRAGVSAFGFGGSNFHCVLEESPSLPPQIDWDRDVFFAAWSADSAQVLSDQLAAWSNAADPKELQRRAALARQSFQPGQAHRLVIVADARTADISQLIVAARANLTTYAERASWSTPDGISYSSGPRAGKLGLLFPGQGSQYVHMQRELACRFPILQDVLAEANEVFTAYSPLRSPRPRVGGESQGEGASVPNERPTPHSSRLSDYIYPHPAFDAAAKDRQETALRDTEIAQPALGAVSLGLLAVLAEFGVRPEVVAGHSYGELTALCASKRFAPAALYRLSMLRGRLMAEAQEVDGGMLAVGAPATQVEAALKEAAVDLVIANRNSPTQVVLSGRVAELDRVSEVFAKKNIRGKRLPVAAAFHSPLVAAASRRFRPELDEIEFRVPEIPVFANTNAEEYPADAESARSLLAGQLAQPVEFVRQIENMYAAGVRTFVEVGPGAVLTGLVNSILSGRDFRAVAVDGSSGRRSGLLDLASALGQLAVAGIPVDVSVWNPLQAEPSAPQSAASPRLTIPLTGANYVKPRTPRPPVRREVKVSPQSAPPVERQATREEMPVQKPAAKIEPKPAAASTQYSVPGTLYPAKSERPLIATHAPKPAASQPSAIIPQPSTLTPRPSSGLFVLQQMFEQTATLHRQFLEGQEQALQTLERLAGGAPMPALNREPRVAAELPRAEVGASTQYPVHGTPYAAQESASAPQNHQPSACVVRPAERPVSSPSGSPPATPAPQPAVNAQLTADVLAVVAEKTGYPAEMLKPEMSLDHDLGIDSIKRVEILSALQERRPDLPAVQPEQLGTLHRLEDVIALIGQSTPHDQRDSAPAVAAAGVQPSAVNSELAAVVLAVVAEKTGYPAEMLKPEMSLDHDLGIDSIKRVEILSALQERRPDLPAVQPEQLGTLHRLEDVIALISQATRDSQRDSGPVVVPADSPPSTLDLQPSLTLGRPRSTPLTDAGRPLAIPEGGTFFVTEDGSGLSQRIAERLGQLGYRPQLVRLEDAAGHAVPDDLAGLIVIAPEGGIADQQLWRAVEWTQNCGPALRRAGRQSAAVLATISRLDGEFGFGPTGAPVDPLSGSLAGLAKTARHEWPEVSATAFDLASEVERSADVVSQLVDRLLSAGPSEIGRTQNGWRQIEVRDDTSSDNGTPPVQPGELIVITGGARGVTAACALAVAHAWKPRLALCGRTALAAEPDWLAACSTPAQIKQALAQHAAPGTPLRHLDQQSRQAIANREVRATLAAIRAAGVDAEYLAVDIRDLAGVRTAFRELEAKFGPIRGVIHGAGVLEDRRIEDKTREQFEHVFSTKTAGLRNVLGALDPSRLKCLALFSSYTARFGRTGQVDYAMANEALNKFAAQFQAGHPVCRTRSFNWGPWDGGMVTDSLKPLFAKEGVGLIPLAAGANLLVSELERAESDGVEIVVLANAGQPAGSERQAEQQKADNAPLASAAPAGVEASVPDAQLVELVLSVVAEKTGYPAEMLKPQMSLDHDLGIDSIKRVEILSALQERRPDLPVVKPEQLGTLHRLEDVIALIGQSTRNGTQDSEPFVASADSRLSTIDSRTSPNPQPSTLNPQPSTTRSGWERTLDVAGHSYLASHVIGGKAVFPTALIVETLAHAALHHHPGLEFAGFSNLRIFKGVRIGGDERIALRALAEKATRAGGEFQIPVRLVSTAGEREVIHAQAELLLGGNRVPPRPSRLLAALRGQAVAPPTDWYGRLLFHGPALHGLERIESLTTDGIVVRAKSASAPSEWLAEPWRTAWLADPLAIDVVLQAIIVWTQTVCERASLPTAIGTYRQFVRMLPRDGVRIAIRADRRNEATVIAEAELIDGTGAVVAEFTGIEHVLDAQLSAAFRRNRLE